jgi:predicted outer membrane repeat protein
MPQRDLVQKFPLSDPRSRLGGAWRAAGCLASLVLGLAAALGLLLAAGGRPAQAAPASTLWTVNPGDSIQTAINNASTGDTILINAGTYTESLNLTKAVSLTGVSSATVILQAIAGQRVLTATGAAVNSSVVISGLTFTGGDVTGAVWPDDCGGGVELASFAEPALVNVTLINNQAGTGGGLCALSTSPLSLTSSLVQSNTANAPSGGWGGGVDAYYPATLSGVRLQGNQCLGADCYGGGVAASLALTLTNSTLLSNTAQAGGGGAQSQGAMVVSGGLVSGNTCAQANCSGGGLYAKSTLTLTGTQFISNSAPGAAGGLLASGAATVTSALFQQNSCTQSLCEGGAVLAGSALTLSSTQVLSNSALSRGGGVEGDSAVVLNAVVFQDNVCTQANCQGGALWLAGPLTANSAQFISNTSTSHGGALYNFGPGLVSAGLFQNNQCTQSGCLGGALFGNDALALTGTQFISSAAGHNGGALYASGTLVLTNTQFLSNTAPASGGGAYAAGATTVSGGLFQNNQCTTTAGCDGGGLYAGSLTLTGTQFLSNTAHQFGGALAVNLTSTVSSALFQANTCGPNDGSFCLGGGLSSIFGVTLSGTSFFSNTAQAGGAGLYANLAADITGGKFLNDACTNTDCQGGALFADGPLAVTSTQFISNSAGSVGGAVLASGPLTVTGGLFQSNACTQANCQAGALRAGDLLVLTGTQFFSNTSRGGGAAVDASGTTKLTNALFQANACADSGCQGGALLATAATLNGVTFAGNHALGFGGALLATQGLTLTNGLFQSNACDNCEGGGVFVDGGLALTGTQFINNTSNLHGGGAYAGTASLSGGLFRGNACTQPGCQGGALYVSTGPVSVNGTQFTNNQSQANGGALRGAGATALKGGQLTGNLCSLDDCSGGAVYAAGSLTLSGTQLTHDQSGSDGGAVAVTGTLTLTNALVQANQCTRFDCRGGGVFAGGTLALSGTQVISNSSGSSGAGAFATGPATLAGGLFQVNACTQANCSGGGLYAQETLSLTATSFDGNSAFGDGGGAYAGGDAALAGGLFQNNACTQDGCRGGGLHAVQGLSLSGTQFLTNTARAGGGGAFGNAGAADRVNNGLFLNNHCTDALCAGGGLDVLSSLALTGTQFSKNSAISSGGGLYAGAPATLDQAAFFNNTAFLGGGLYHAGPSGHVINSVFGNNLAGNAGAAIFINTNGTIILKQDTIGMPDYDVPTSSVALLSGNLAVTNTIFILYDIGIDSGPGHVFEDYNLFDHVGHPAQGNVVSGGHSFNGAARPANPDFDNYHLLPGSAAIDAGVSDGVPVDFDGQPRPHGAGYDIGFDEAYFDMLYLPLVRRP